MNTKIIIYVLNVNEKYIDEEINRVYIDEWNQCNMIKVPKKKSTITTTTTIKCPHRTAWDLSY